MRNIDIDNPYYIHSTIKRGAILYIVIALLAVPSALCSQQHQIPVYDPPMPEMPQLSALETGPPGPDASIETPEPAAEAEDASAAAENVPTASDEDMPPFYDHISKASESYQVDAALIRAIIMAESGYNPKAVSHRGARGLMQLMPNTAKWLGVDDAFDPALNIDGGVRYFKRLLDRFQGDVELALAAYNAGSRYVRKYGGVPPFRATKLYIRKVLHYHKKYLQEMAVNEAPQPSV